MVYLDDRIEIFQALTNHNNLSINVLQALAEKIDSFELPEERLNDTAWLNFLEEIFGDTDFLEDTNDEDTSST